MALAPPPPRPVLQEAEPEYPSSDGEPIADSSTQYEAITSISGEIGALFADDSQVSVHADLFWYPVQGAPREVRAPDTMVIFGRPQQTRDSYKQWDEGGVAPQVTFEVKSHSNSEANLERTFQFYNRHGVEEYYLYDPFTPRIYGWRREGGRLTEITPIHGWMSPRLGITFTQTEEEGVVFYRPDGQRFRAMVTVFREAVADKERAHAAERRAIGAQIRAEQAEAHAEHEQARAEQERIRAEHEQARAEQEARARVAAEQAATAANAEIERLLARLRAAGLNDA